MPKGRDVCSYRISRGVAYVRLANLRTSCGVLANWHVWESWCFCGFRGLGVTGLGCQVDGGLGLRIRIYDLGNPQMGVIDSGRVGGLVGVCAEGV